jgi:hypothetical protein
MPYLRLPLLSWSDHVTQLLIPCVQCRESIDVNGGLVDERLLVEKVGQLLSLVPNSNGMCSLETSRHNWQKVWHTSQRWKRVV